MTLEDGRRLCFDDVGDPDGRPVLYVHGTPDSRRARHPDDTAAAALGVRLIAVDRPGAGGSDPHPAGTVGSFADDAAALAAHLGITRWGVLAWSAGALFGLAVAARHPALVDRVGIVAGLPPFAAYAEPGVLDGAGPDRRTIAELGAELGAAGRRRAARPARRPVAVRPRAGPRVRAGGRRRRPAGRAGRRAGRDRRDGGRRRRRRGPGASPVCTRDIELQVLDPDIDLADVRCPVQLWYGTADHVGAAVVRPLVRRPPPGRLAGGDRRRRPLPCSSPGGRRSSVLSAEIGPNGPIPKDRSRSLSAGGRRPRWPSAGPAG